MSRNFSYSLAGFLITGTFFSLLLLFFYLTGELPTTSPIWINIVYILAATALFQPIHQLVQRIIDQYFYKGKFDYQRILSKYSEALVRPTTDLNYLATMFCYLLWKSMKVYGVSLIVLDAENQRYISRSGEGVGESLVGQSLPEDSPIINELYLTKKEISREIIKKHLRNQQLPEEVRKKLTNILADLNFLKASLLIPCISESNFFHKPTLLSIISLGKKMSLDSYTAEDIDFLKTIANQAALCIEYTFIFEELKRQQDQVLRSEKLAALGTLASGIAHELKNPLTYLSTVAQAMGKQWDDKHFKESVLRVFPNEIERMKLIIDGLSDYSKTQDVRMEKTEIGAIIEKVMAILGYEVKKHNITVNKSFSEGTPPFYAVADKNRLSQVFLNILVNSIQAMGIGGTLSIAINNVDGRIEIVISDTGSGITAENLSRLFEPFFSTKESGVGLGLYLSKQIIDQHGGKISAASIPGKGSTFTITLPVAV